MLEKTSSRLEKVLPKSRIEEINQWIAKYPSNERQSAVMSALRITQEEHRYLTVDLMDAVAEYLAMPPIAVYEVATFYSMYEHAPTGRHVLNICTNISCQLAGSRDIVDYFKKRWNLQLGETSADGRFTLRSVECLGACVHAPVMDIEKQYHEKLTPEKLDNLLEQYP